eukprot:177873_1
MDESTLIGGIIFTIIYTILLCIFCFAGMTSGVEGNDGKLCVAMTIAVIISIPVMWVIYSQTDSEVGFWIMSTLPLWCMPWAIYICWENMGCTRVFKGLCCCCCDKQPSKFDNF